MTYKFDLEYIPRSFLEAHPTMHEDHFDFQKAISKTEIIVVGNDNDGTSIEDIKASIIDAYERDGCKMLKIVGGLVS
jgi:hypothetical protein